MLVTPSAKHFLDLLEDRGLLPDFQIESLRRQVAESDEAIEAHHIARLLLRKGKLTPFQARRLLADLGESDESQLLAPPSADQPPAPGEAAPSAGDDNGLGLAEVEEDIPKTQRRRETQKSSAAPKTPAAPEAPPQTDEPDAAPGLDELLDDPLLSDESAADPLMPAPKQQATGLMGGLFGGGQTKPRRPRAGGWDSPLILVGGGVLVVLILAGGLIAFILTRSSGDDLLKAAEQDYSAGAYGQAMAKYEDFLTHHGNHPQASLARVRLVLADLRQTVARQDWEAALAKAQQGLPPIEQEPEFPAARTELAGLLPEIAEGLANEARESSDLDEAAQWVKKFEAAIELVNNTRYLPGSLRALQQPRVVRMQETVSGVVRDIEQSHKLDEALAQIAAATAEKDAALAYQIRHDLLQVYPRLSADPRLTQAVRGVADVLRGQVKVSDETLAASAKDHPSPLALTLALAAQNGGRADSMKGRVVPIMHRGALYALSAEDGRLLWRRFVGAASHIPPLPVSQSPGADLLVADARRREVMRLAGSSGKLVWRLPLGEQPTALFVEDDLALVITAGARLLAIDLPSGDSRRQIPFPQKLAGTLGVSRERLYLPAEHSNFFVLDRATWQCQDVVYLGHKPRMLATPPVAVAGHVIVAENHAIDRSRLHVFRHSDDDRLQPAGTTKDMDGQVHVPPLVDGGRIFVATNLGGIYAYGLEPADENNPLHPLASRPAVGSSPQPVTAVARDGRLWVAQRRLSEFSLSTAGAGLVQRWVEDEGDTFTGNLAQAGSVMFHQRHAGGQAGLLVSAVNLSDADGQTPGTRLWETQLAAGSAGAAFSDENNGPLLAMTQTGKLYAVDSAAQGEQVNNTPLAAAATGKTYAAPLSVGEGQLAFPTLPPSLTIALLDPAKQSIKDVAFELPAGKIACQPVAWRGGLLWASDAGQIHLLDPSGKSLLHPFQPRLEPGEPLHWRLPAVIDEDRFVVSDGLHRLFVVTVEATPEPHLASVAEAVSKEEIISSPVVLKDSAWCVGRSQAEDLLLAYSLNDMKPTHTASLGGRLVWGPFVAGEVLFVQTGRGELKTFDSSGKPLGTISLGDDQFIVPLLPVGDPFFMATVGGRIWRWSRNRMEKVFDAGQPLASSPARYKDRIYLRAQDGSVFAVPLSLLTPEGSP